MCEMAHCERNRHDNIIHEMFKIKKWLGRNLFLLWANLMIRTANCDA